MTDEQTADTADSPTPDTPRRRRGRADTLRYVPPAAALGTAFVLQVVLITDTVGAALAGRYPDSGTTWIWYLLAGLLGLSVASCVEGGAAYLMDLYDRHLLARDSVWLLRLAMAVYVAVSALAVHWWAGQRDLPELLSWVLAAMSGSALFLWSRGSRWQHRQQMIAAGQMDPALPRLPTSAKLLHPIRWLVTLYLISWRPVRTTDEARARYERWQDVRSGKVARTDEYVAEMVEVAQAQLSDTRRAVLAELDGLRRTAESDVARIRSVAEADAVRIRERLSAELDAASAARAEADRLLADATARRSDSGDHTVVPLRRTRTQPRDRVGVPPTVAELADTLTAKHGQEYVGLPTALSTLKATYGSCSKERAIEAKDIHNARREQADTGQDDSEERDRAPQLAGATA